jgi:electron-transferring-flavoprotein dehydrogenase
MDFDVVIVGAGPAGLAAACRLGQAAADAGREISVCVVEKGAEVGAHILSGAVLETRALDELFPDWRDTGAPVETAVSGDRVAWLVNAERAVDVPNAFVPRSLHNRGNYIVSLGRLCAWLAEQAEAMGCNVFPGFAASEVLYDASGAVAGVATGDMGIGKDGRAKQGMQPGIELKARYTIFAEGSRGSLGRELETKYRLRRDADPQHYGLGLKEIWQIDPALHREGEVLHTLGWPLDNATEGGGFVYHAVEHKLYLGLIVALNYKNPRLNPFQEFQRWKLHPRIRRLLAGAKRIGFGARVVNKGGWQSLPELVFPGGVLVGCEAGLLNGAKIKGSHTAMKSGMLAADAILAALAADDTGGARLDSYTSSLRNSWVYEELYAARNFSPAIARFGTLLGGALAYLEQNILRGRVPYTVHNRRADHETLVPLKRAAVIDYPAPDGVVTFDRLSSVYLSNTHHEEDQPCHLVLTDAALPVTANLPVYGEPAQIYCPAAVYEIVADSPGSARFQINASNCLHCKCCDIKDPAQNIRWKPPEGGGGPNYVGM